MEYSINIEHNILYLKLEGKLIMPNKNNQIYQQIEEQIAEGIVRCAVDISGLELINSVGIGVLVTLLTKFRNRGGEVVLVKPSEHIKKLLILTKLSAIFTIVDSQEEAIEILN